MPDMPTQHKEGIYDKLDRQSGNKSKVVLEGPAEVHGDHDVLARRGSSGRAGHYHVLAVVG